MFLDEKLLRVESEKAEREKREKCLQEIREDFLKKEREQKTVEERIAELRLGKAVIDEKDISCERRNLLDERVPVFVFPEDVDRIFQENSIATIIYRTLGIGTNLTILKEPLRVGNEALFQKGLTEQYQKDQITYYPLDTGSMKSADRKLQYATGVITSAIGGVFIINFYCGEKGGTVTGNYTCQLTRRYAFEHLFLAMLRLMYEEDNQ